MAIDASAGQRSFANVDANTKVCGSEDGWQEEPNTKLAKLTSEEPERHTGLILANTWSVRKWWERRQRNRGTKANTKHCGIDVPTVHL